MDLSPNIAVLVAVIGGLGGASGIVALLSIRGTIRQANAAAKQAESAASKADVETLRIIVDAVQGENKRLRDLVEKLGAEVEELCETIRKYLSGIDRLIHQIETHGLKPDWRPKPSKDIP